MQSIQVVQQVKHLSGKAAASKRLKTSPGVAVEQRLVFVALLRGVPLCPGMQSK